MERQFKPEFLKKMGECMLSHSIKPQRHRRHSAIAPQNSQFLLLMKAYILDCKIIRMSLSGWNSLRGLLQLVTIYHTLLNL